MDDFIRVTINIALLTIGLGGAISFEHGPMAGVPFFVAAGMLALIAMLLPVMRRLWEEL